VYHGGSSTPVAMQVEPSPAGIEVVEVASTPLPQVVEPKKKSKVQLLLGSENTLMP